MIAGPADWGSVPAWLGLGGALIAAMSFLAGRRDAKRRPAALVFPITVNHRFGTSKPPDTFTNVQIENGSDMPIYDCILVLYQWGRRRRLWRFHTVQNWMTGERVVGRVYSIIRANSVSQVAELPGLGLPPQGKGWRAQMDMAPTALLMFRDGNGRRWVRWPDGKLTRLRPSRHLPR